MGEVSIWGFTKKASCRQVPCGFVGEVVWFGWLLLFLSFDCTGSLLWAHAAFSSCGMRALELTGSAVAA